jgi:hypothetical protein
MQKNCKRDAREKPMVVGLTIKSANPCETILYNEEDDKAMVYCLEHPFPKCFVVEIVLVGASCV